MLKNQKKNDYSLIPKYELIQLINSGYNLTDIARKYKKNLHYIRTIFQKYNLKTKQKQVECLNCKKVFNSSPSSNAKYCSSKCRSAHWPKKNPKKHSELCKKSRLKCNPVQCKYCHKLIPNTMRKSGLVYCSDKCRKNNRKIKEKQRREKNYIDFSEYKLSIGCQNVNCLYDRCASSLDFHHIDPQQKKTRITCCLWKSNNKIFRQEIRKCILLCKNCHYEAHKGLLDIYKQDGRWICKYRNS